MFKNFQADIPPVEAGRAEIGAPDLGAKSEIPSMSELKSKMEQIFSAAPRERSDAAPKEAGAARELTEDEKINLTEKLGWADKQFSKCTMSESGEILYKTDREDLEGKTSENGVPYERKTVDIYGIKVQGVFPVFESVCDVRLPADLEKASNARQFRECNRQLKEKIDKDPELKKSFHEGQLEDIECGDTPSGYVWHHKEETGEMQLVKIEDHDRTQGGAAHTGGKALWGGGYTGRETAGSGESGASKQTTD